MASASREYDRKPEAEIQKMIQDRQVKIQEVKRSVELSRKDADTVITDIVQVNVHQSSCVGTVRTAVAQLEKTLSEEMKRLRIAELRRIKHYHSPSKRVSGERPLVTWLIRRIQRYAVTVTMDPDTAHPNIILSDDGKQVSLGNVYKKLPDNTERFSLCVAGLGKQSFSSGRFYYEVQVGGKTGWAVGVARESINRKGQICVRPNNGYWTIVLRNGNQYKAAAGPTVLLPVREELQKVGVFVDYEEGLVSFYDVEAGVHLYSFTGCSFTERLYPLFSPCLNENGTNSAPLIISPVNHSNEGQGL